MKLVPEVGFVGGGIVHAGFVCGEAGGYTGVEVGGDFVGKVGMGIKFACIWPPAFVVGGRRGWGEWGLRNVRSVRVRGPDVGPVEGSAEKGVVVVLAGAWALPVTRAVVYFARVEKGCQVAGGPLLINDGMGGALSWACSRGGGAGLTMSEGVEVGGGGGV